MTKIPDRLLTLILDQKYRKVLVNHKIKKLLFVQKLDLKVNLEDGINNAEYINFNLSNAYLEMVKGQIKEGAIWEFVDEDDD